MENQAQAAILDETGFEFIGDDNKQYLCAMRGGDAWFFYKHPDGQWVSLRKVNQTEVWQAANRNKEQSKTNPVAVEERLYRWVKASDRKPENNWTGFVSWTDSSAYAILYDDKFYDHNIYSSGLAFTNQKDILWLEEIPIKEHLPVVEDGKEDAKLKLAASNWRELMAANNEIRVLKNLLKEGIAKIETLGMQERFGLFVQYATKAIYPSQLTLLEEQGTKWNIQGLEERPSKEDEQDKIWKEFMDELESCWEPRKNISDLKKQFSIKKQVL